MIFSSTIGWLGTILIVLAFFLIEAKHLSVSTKTYQFMNIIGATGVAINSYFQGAWPSVGLQIIWIIIGLSTLIKILRK